MGEEKAMSVGTDGRQGAAARAGDAAGVGDASRVEGAAGAEAASGIGGAVGTGATAGIGDAAEADAAAGARDAVAEDELNANGHVLPGHWKRTIAVIWTGQAASILATCAATFAVLWYLTTTADSALMLAAAGVAALLPTALLSPFGGVVADRFNKKAVMIVADGTAGALSLVLALVVAAGFAEPALFLLLLAARSSAQAFHGTSLMALMPELVPERDMVRINTLDQVLSSASAIVGPVLGIALYSAFGFTAVLVADAACALVACLCLAVARLPYARTVRQSTGTVMGDLREGLSIIAGDKAVRSLLAMVTVAMLLFLPLGTLSPLMTYDWFGGDGFAASAVEAAAGIGMLVGSLGMLVWGGGKRLVPVLVGAGLAIGAGCIVCGILPQSVFPAFVGLIGFIFAATALFNAPVIPLMQKRIAPERFGRVMGLFGSITTLASPVGLFIAGPAAEALGVNRWFVIAGVIMVVAMVLSAGSKRLRSLDEG